MNPLDLGPSAIRRLRGIIDSIRRQAPGARMIGELVVKVASKDVIRRLGLSDDLSRGFDQGRTHVNDSSAQVDSDSENGGAA